jgi:hypothetical protein
MTNRHFLRDATATTRRRHARQDYGGQAAHPLTVTLTTHFNEQSPMRARRA